MNLDKLESWLKLAARVSITATCLFLGTWLVVVQQAEMGYSFITFVAGYWLK